MLTRRMVGARGFARKGTTVARLALLVPFLFGVVGFFGCTQATASDPFVDICNLLEGVPLVLELAAGRLRLFPLQEVHSWLRRDGDSHLSGLVDVPPRQRSLLAAAEWSCHGLTDGQRALLARLACPARSRRPGRP